jgi:hypothetical protein
VSCFYYSSQATVFGIGSEDEMCEYIIYIYVYKCTYNIYVLMHTNDTNDFVNIQYIQYMHAYIHKYDVHTCVYIHTYIHTHTHTHTHSLTHSLTHSRVQYYAGCILE